VADLDSERVGDYFATRDTVAHWWTPDEGPLAFHYDAELAVLDDQLGARPDWQVLDVGTGRGRFGVHLAARGCRVTGVDLNPDMIEVARETARRRGVEERFEIRQGDATDLSAFGPQRFDAVLCMELFDHLPDLGAALRAMRGALKADGVLAFTYVPSESLYGALGNAYRAVRARLRPTELMISRTYSLSEVRRALAEAGLRLDGYWGIGVLCVNAQTRLFSGNPLLRLATSVARAESRRWPYHASPGLARRGAHVVGFARHAGGDAG
jgi:2-polyprenyl-6-hydroxyphenyl methylase/3-demethylubiquinone-9 3-methyltransferase